MDNFNLGKDLFKDERFLKFKLKFHLTKEGELYLKNNNSFVDFSKYEYAVNCYEIELYLFLYYFEDMLEESFKKFIKVIPEGYIERSLCGSGGCIHCPFSISEEADKIYNLGCLPTVSDIVRMKKESGHNWACHSNEKVLCGGFYNFMKENYPDLDLNNGGLINYNDWYLKGEDYALKVLDFKFKE